MGISLCRARVGGLSASAGFSSWSGVPPSCSAQMGWRSPLAPVLAASAWGSRCADARADHFSKPASEVIERLRRLGEHPAPLLARGHRGRRSGLAAGVRVALRRCARFRRCGSGSGSMSSCVRRRTAGAGFEMERALFALVANRACAPASNCTVMNSGSRRMYTSKARKAWRCISSTARWTFSRRTRRRSSRRSSSRSPTC